MVPAKRFSGQKSVYAEDRKGFNRERCRRDERLYSLAMRWGMAWALILLLMCPALRA